VLLRYSQGERPSSEVLSRLVAPLVRVQVEASNKPGALDVWALIDTAMHKMTVHVPRKLYVDVAPENAHLVADARRVDRILPDGSEALTMLEIEVSEEEFLQEAKVRFLVSTTVEISAAALITNTSNKSWISTYPRYAGRCNCGKAILCP
jgi:hypothetical protein